MMPFAVEACDDHEEEVDEWNEISRSYIIAVLEVQGHMLDCDTGMLHENGVGEVEEEVGDERKTIFTSGPRHHDMI